VVRPDRDESAPPRPLDRAERAPVSRTSAQVGPVAMASWRPSARLEPVERYARFEILGRIGRGGMAEILLARERSLTGGSRHLVIKRVLPEALDFDEMLHMFLDETRIVMGLSHPNLCQIYEVGEQDGAWFIAMEWVNGVTLHQLLRRALDTGDVDYGVLARVASQCAEALHYAHTARDAEGQLISLVHRDVSPHNLMIAYDGRVKLLDFGIAKSTATTHRTEAGVVKGKICYMAPEQWLSHPLDGRTDVFSLGACLYEALSGRVVFKRDHQMEVMKAAIAGDVPLLAEIAPQVPAALAEIAHRALLPKPEARFQTAREMSEALERFLSSLGEPISAARISDYTRRLFPEEVQLGPMLERALRGGELTRDEDMFLPPLPASLLGAIRSVNSLVPVPISVSTQPAELPAEVVEHKRSVPPAAPSSADDITEPARLGATRTEALRAVVPAVDETLKSPSEAPARSKVPSLRDLLPVYIARPLVRTMSMHAGSSARRALFALALALTAGLPLFFGARALFRDDARHTLVSQPLASPSVEDTRVGAFHAPAFTLLPPVTPLTASPLAPRTATPPLARGLVRANGAEAREQADNQLVGRLSINTRPWSTVYLGKRMLGTTPLADIAVPLGALNLRLVDRDGKVHIRRLAASKRKERSINYDF